MSENHSIDLWGLFRWGAMCGLLVWLAVQVIDLRMRVSTLEQIKPAFYTVTDRGKEIRMMQIK